MFVRTASKRAGVSAGLPPSVGASSRAGGMTLMSPRAACKIGLPLRSASEGGIRGREGTE